MANELQERYAKLVLAKLRATSIYEALFNKRYEGTPTAGAVKIPVRDTEAKVAAYDKANGCALNATSTTYQTLAIDHDESVNELIDGYDAAAVPDNIVADRLDSAGYSLAISEDAARRDLLVAKGTALANTTALTAKTVYEAVVDAITAAKKKHVNKATMWLAVNSDVYGLLLKDTDHFIKASALGDAITQTGVVGKIDGVPVVEDPDLEVEFVLGNSDFCHFVAEFNVPVHVQDLASSGKYIGASAVQGRRVYGALISRPETVFVKKSA